MVLNLLSIFIFLGTLNPSGSGRTASFTLQITGIEKARGEVRIAVFNSKDAFAKDAFALAVVPVTGKIVSWQLPELMWGSYAIAVYHDENRNTRLDTNILGAPTERYGFSNDARGLFGPPSWEKARFDIESEQVTVTIQLK
jgi:uncharacterized protein (DUF2141 family)